MSVFFSLSKQSILFCSGLVGDLLRAFGGQFLPVIESPETGNGNFNLWTKHMIFL